MRLVEGGAKTLKWVFVVLHYGRRRKGRWVAEAEPLLRTS